jgi:hypothetical protein
MDSLQGGKESKGELYIFVKTFKSWNYQSRITLVMCLIGQYVIVINLICILKTLVLNETILYILKGVIFRLIDSYL